ncbi:hypothetical protein FHS83_001100 [Rhizomicrobium palustre]|uniref:HPt domain-containing protein n=1 Tax=Rhizomicrobium palustre TaxID=189966 RepID=A0A846MXJ6_9PROT|nr:hypothetical protein [Rhizomicrobium palustre]NIK87782.1 hypothetical protein [Rhizomicrobium palustre]
MSNAKAEFIQPGTYPVISDEAARGLRKALKSTAVSMAATRALAECIPEMREAVLAELPRLEAAGSDAAAVYAVAHEVRGLAGNARLAASAKIASMLCLYLDAVMRAEQPADALVIKLCTSAIGRSARALDEESRLGLHVVKELGVLVSRKLAEISDPSAASDFIGR